MKVKFNRDFDAHKAGAEVDIPDAQARAAVDAGAAEEVAQPKDRPPAKAPAKVGAGEEDGGEQMRLRFRHDATLGQKGYLAGQAQMVPVSDEAWELVNQGHADLDPPPGARLGEHTQPFPPDWTQQDPAPEPKAVQATPAQTAALTPAPTAETVGRNPHQPPPRAPKR